jgi:hypothetical protein
MKKNFLFIAGLVMILGASSCKSSNSFESDVRKFADMRCKKQQLQAKDQSDESVKKDLEKIEKEMDEYGDKMAKKYEKDKGNKEMDEKADKIMDEVMAKCK